MLHEESLVVEGRLGRNVIVEAGVVAFLWILGIDERAHVWL